jgi:hypothetical protein
MKQSQFLGQTRVNGKCRQFLNTSVDEITFVELQAQKCLATRVEQPCPFMVDAASEKNDVGQ